MESEKALKAISKARAQLILGHPFFAALALRLAVVEEPRAHTMAVDGKHLFYSPDWVNAQKPDHLVTIVAHEAMHCALHHPFRRGSREPERANIAMDHAVNLILKDAGFPMPKHATMDPKFAGMAFEQIYNLLPANPPQQQGAMPDYGGFGSVIDATSDDGKPLPEAEREALERDWKVALLQAAQAAKAQGKLPGSLASLAEAIRAPQLDWRVLLREFIRAVAANDFSWRRPNTRFLAAGDYLPSLYDETVGPIAMGVDTSGSVSQAELDAVCSELNACLDTARPESVHVVYCDAQVHGHEVFAPDDWPVKMHAKGRGGTHLAPIWPYIERHDVNPVCAIITTDMQLGVRDLGDDPGYPVLFLSTGRESPIDGPLPYGALVKVEVQP
jgi:predicted metal-dependent peptidase